MSSLLTEPQMSQIKENMKNACDRFWLNLENNNLIKTSINQSIDTKDLLTLMNQDHKIILNGLQKIVEKENNIADHEFPSSRFEEFIILLKAYEFVINLEQLKDMFADCLDETKLLKSNKRNRRITLKDITLGEMIYSINDLLYPLNQVNNLKKENYKALREEHRDLFFLDFRNAIVHRKFRIHCRILTYLNNNNEEVNFTAREFTKMGFQFEKLRYYINDKIHNIPVTNS